MSNEKKYTAPNICLHCQNKAPMEIVATYSGVVEHSDEQGEPEWAEGPVWQLAVCPACRDVCLFREYYHSHAGPYEEDIPQIIYPLAGRKPQGMPLAVERALEAARRVKSIDANAFGVLARRLLEIVCIDRNAQGKTLIEQLNFLAKNNEIPEKLVHVAQNLRQLGNIGAHAGSGDLTEGEVRVIEELLAALLDYVYTAPHLANMAAAALEKLKKTQVGAKKPKA